MAGSEVRPCWRYKEDAEGERRRTSKKCQDLAALEQRTRRLDLALNGEGGGKNVGEKLEQETGTGTA